MVVLNWVWYHPIAEAEAAELFEAPATWQLSPALPASAPPLHPQLTHTLSVSLRVPVLMPSCPLQCAQGRQACCRSKQHRGRTSQLWVGAFQRGERPGALAVRWQ